MKRVILKHVENTLTLYRKLAADVHKRTRPLCTLKTQSDEFSNWPYNLSIHKTYISSTKLFFSYVKIPEEKREDSRHSITANAVTSSNFKNTNNSHYQAETIIQNSKRPTREYKDDCKNQDEASLLYKCKYFNQGAAKYKIRSKTF